MTYRVALLLPAVLALGGALILHQPASAGAESPKITASASTTRIVHSATACSATARASTPLVFLSSLGITAILLAWRRSREIRGSAPSRRAALR